MGNFCAAEEMNADKEFIRQIQLKCLLVVGVFALLAIAEYSVLEFQNQDHTNQAHLINRTGYQRMLTQRTAWMSTRFVMETNRHSRREIRAKLLSSLEKLESWHNSLISKCNERIKPTLRTLYFKAPTHLDPQMQRYIQEVNALVADPESELKPTNQHFKSISRMADTKNQLLKGLEKAIDVIEHDEVSHAHFLNLLFIGLIFLNLLVLMLVWQFIFRPMLTTICQKQEENIKSQEMLKQTALESQKNNRILQTISQLQSKFIMDIESKVLFEEFLKEILTLTQSKAGLIGEILFENNQPYLKRHALMDVSGNPTASLTSYQMDNLLDNVIATGKPIILNDFPDSKPVGLHSLLGLPIYRGMVCQRNQLIGIIALANHPNGYTEEFIEFLDPLLLTYGNLIEAYRNHLLRKQAEEEVKLLQAIALAISGAENLEETLNIVLYKVCSTTGWGFGQVWIPSSDNSVLECSPAWYNNIQGVEAFRKLSEEMTFPPNIGLPGRVWVSKKPIWILDVTQDGNFPRAPIALEAGLRTALCIPVLSDIDVVAVIEFFLVHPRPEDEKLIQLVSAVAMQLGALIQRKKMEEALQQSEESLRQAHNELEGIVEERTLELKQVNDLLKNELSERKHLESQLVQAQKMESLGQMAAGVAHEINNPVGFVTSNLGALSKYVIIFKQLLEQYGQLSSMVRSESPTNGKGEILERIETICPPAKLDYILEDVDNLLIESKDGTKRVQEIVQGLKSFSRVDEAEIKEANINECIESTLKIVWNELKYKCEVHKQFGNIPAIRCYPGQLNQVFMNFLVNAAQAISEKGEIFITTQVLCDEIVITFRDTGNGIPEETLPHIFDPFYTTKPVGQGTGLGLSISYGIIQKHHGLITVDSTVGKGTTFTIKLPLAGVLEPNPSIPTKI